MQRLQLACRRPSSAGNDAYWFCDSWRICAFRTLSVSRPLSSRKKQCPLTPLAHGKA